MPSEFHYDIDPNFDFVIEEKANSYMAFRKIKWGDSENYKLDLRKYQSTESGERMLKGCSFISDEGAHELTKVLLDQGFGHASDIVNSIKENRKDIYAEFVKDIKGIPDDEAKRIVEESGTKEEEYYDLREVI